jgi:hypothetical protein
LRPTQHFDALQIDQIRQRAGNARIDDAVNVETDRTILRTARRLATDWPRIAMVTSLPPDTAIEVVRFGARALMLAMVVMPRVSICAALRPSPRSALPAGALRASARSRLAGGFAIQPNHAWELRKPSIRLSYDVNRQTPILRCRKATTHRISADQ